MSCILSTLNENILFFWMFSKITEDWCTCCAQIYKSYLHGNFSFAHQIGKFTYPMCMVIFYFCQPIRNIAVSGNCRAKNFSVSAVHELMY